MYELLRIENRTITTADTDREWDVIRARALERSSIDDAVFAVRREGFREALIYVWRGKLTGDPLEILRRVLDPDPQAVPAPQYVGANTLGVVVNVIETPDNDEPAEVIELDDFDTMILADLRELARELNITGRSGMSKDELIAAIRDRQGRQTGPSETKARTHSNKEREYKVFPAATINIDEAQGIVEAIVNTYGIVDDGDDRVWFGAASKTLAENFGRIRVLNSHNNRSVLDVVGKPLEMRELNRAELPPDVLMRWPDATGGLYTKTQYLIDTPEGLGVFKRIAAGAVDEYSIGFDAIVTEPERDTDPMSGKPRIVRNIREIRLWEYSPVVWGMNPATASISAKAASEIKPYDVFEVDGEFCVYKIDEAGERTGDTLGCHPDRDSAFAQIAAIEHSEEDGKQAAEPDSYSSPSVEVLYHDNRDGLKIGRVLSERNLSAIKQAYELLATVMQSAGLNDGDDDEDMSKSRIDNNDATDGPPASTAAPTSTEAGPPDDETPELKRTRLLATLQQRLADVEVIPHDDEGESRTL